MRHIGVDLHKTNFVACFIGADDTQRIETYPLTRDGLARFVAQLGAEDELAAAAWRARAFFPMTGNTLIKFIPSPFSTGGLTYVRILITLPAQNVEADARGP